LQPKAETVFEVSWEICNKVGGIYTVIVSKAELMKSNYKNYFAIGPYFKDKAQLGFEETSPPQAFKDAFKKMEEQGIKCHYGRWLIKGDPNCILIESAAWFKRRDEFRKNLWEYFKVDTLLAGYDYDEPMVWSMAVGELLLNLQDAYPNAVAHFHEWLAGNAILYLKMMEAKIATVFTTHATMLGRSMCGSGMNLYENLEKLDPEPQARALKVIDKFSTERACANNADVFTTVSEITGLEAEKMFGKKPDVLVYNGLDQNKFPSFEEAMIRHRISREIIREYITYHFFPYYFFEIDHSLIYFIVARNEFKNKGLDVMIEALAKMNQKMKEEKTNRTVVVFFWIPRQTFGIRIELLENKTFYRQIEYSVDSFAPHIKKKIISSILSQNKLKLDNLMPDEFKMLNKKLFMHFKREGNPPILTHYVSDEYNDEILNSLKANGLDNSADDPVKVIYNPIYLDGADGLINLNYYDALAGCHMGIFPSYYEPWGYTPLECMSFGVPAVTTDQAGFGRYISGHLLSEKPEDEGIFILERMNKEHKEVTEKLYEILHNYALRKRSDRVINKINAKKLAAVTDWKDFIDNYIKAHNLAYVRHFS